MMDLRTWAIHITHHQSRGGRSNEAEIDRLECEPGPKMRGCLTRWFKAPNTFVILTVTHRPSGQFSTVNISKFGKYFRVPCASSTGTIEEGVRQMKDQLIAQWTAMIGDRK